MNIEFLLYILITILTVNAIRVIPLILLTKPITNTFVRSFLYYVPYVTLSVMTFPAIIETTGSSLLGGIALVAGIIVAWCGLGLFPVSIICCLVVFILQMVV